MSEGLTTLHSHSGLERELKFPKHIVLVDEIHEDELIGTEQKKSVTFKRFKNGGVTYIEVPIMTFVNNGGVFKNLMR